MDSSSAETYNDTTYGRNTFRSWTTGSTGEFMRRPHSLQINYDLRSTRKDCRTYCIQWRASPKRRNSWPKTSATGGMKLETLSSWSHRGSRRNITTRQRKRKSSRLEISYASSSIGSRQTTARAPKDPDHKLRPHPPPPTPGNSITDHGEALALPSVTGWPSCLRAGRSTTSFPSPTHLRRYRGKSDDIRPLPITVDGEEEYEV